MHMHFQRAQAVAADTPAMPYGSAASFQTVIQEYPRIPIHKSVIRDEPASDALRTMKMFEKAKGQTA